MGQQRSHDLRWIPRQRLRCPSRAQPVVYQSPRPLPGATLIPPFQGWRMTTGSAFHPQGGDIAGRPEPV